MAFAHFLEIRSGDCINDIDQVSIGLQMDGRL
jgi:hypothetical protein